MWSLYEAYNEACNEVFNEVFNEVYKEVLYSPLVVRFVNEEGEYFAAN